MYRVLVSKSFQTEFDVMPPDFQSRVRKALKCLEDDPLRPRPGADIKPLEATDPPKRRIRVEDSRIVYFIDGQTVKVLDMFRRGRGYRP